jgi:hypothetical protein
VGSAKLGRREAATGRTTRGRSPAPDRDQNVEPDQGSFDFDLPRGAGGARSCRPPQQAQPQRYGGKCATFPAQTAQRFGRVRVVRNQTNSK